MKVKVLTITIIALFFGNVIIGQTQPDWRKLHYLSEEEMLTPFTKSKTFYPTDPPEGIIRNVAEFDQMLPPRQHQGADQPTVPLPLPPSS